VVTGTHLPTYQRSQQLLIAHSTLEVFDCAVLLASLDGST
jgi:hypothetical protein